MSGAIAMDDMVAIPTPKAAQACDNIPALLVLFTDRDTMDAALRMIAAAGASTPLTNPPRVESQNRVK